MLIQNIVKNNYTKFNDYDDKCKLKLFLASCITNDFLEDMLIIVARNMQEAKYLFSKCLNEFYNEKLLFKILLRYPILILKSIIQSI